MVIIVPISTCSEILTQAIKDQHANWQEHNGVQRADRHDEKNDLEEHDVSIVTGQEQTGNGNDRRSGPLEDGETHVRQTDP